MRPKTVPRLREISVREPRAGEPRSLAPAQTAPVDIACALINAETIIMGGFKPAEMPAQFLRPDVVFVNAQASPESVAVRMIENARAGRRIWIVTGAMLVLAALGLGLWLH